MSIRRGRHRRRTPKTGGVSVSPVAASEASWNWRPADKPRAIPATRRKRAVAYYHLAIIRTNLGDYEAALQAADRALAIAPDLTEAHLARAGALVHLDRYEEARTAIGTARAQGNAQIHYGYYLEGVTHDRNNEFVPAYLSFRKAAELRPGWLPAQERLDFLSYATDVQQYLARRGE